jgi:hypothetical protein
LDREIAAFDALAKHPRLDALAAFVGDEAGVAAEARRWTGWSDKAGARLDALGLGEAEATSEFGDLRAVLRRGPETEGEALLVRALSAHALASKPPRDDAAQSRLAADLLWLAAETPFDGVRLLDRALGEELAESLWSPIATRVRRAEAPGGARAEALVGLAALLQSRSPFAAKLTARLRRELRDPWLMALLGRDEGALLEGELRPGPRSALATVCLAITGILFVVSAARLFGRVALAFKRPARVRIGPSGIDIEAHTEMLGRTLREHRVRIDRAALARAAREVRYPRLAFYAGLLALALGSYLGVSLLLDGTRAASPSLLALGIAVIGVGIAADFFLAGLSTGIRGKCRIVLVPRRGPSLAIDGLELHAADRALESLRAP